MDTNNGQQGRPSEPPPPPQPRQSEGYAEAEEEEQIALLLPLPQHHLIAAVPTPPLSPVRAKRMDGVYLQREEEGRGGGYGTWACACVCGCGDVDVIVSLYIPTVDRSDSWCHRPTDRHACACLHAGWEPTPRSATGSSSHSASSSTNSPTLLTKAQAEPGAAALLLRQPLQPQSQGRRSKRRGRPPTRQGAWLVGPCSGGGGGGGSEKGVGGGEEEGGPPPLTRRGLARVLRVAMGMGQVYAFFWFVCVCYLMRCVSGWTFLFLGCSCSCRLSYIINHPSTYVNRAGGSSPWGCCSPRRATR